MRKLTFKGFVEAYVEELSYSKTASISKLILELEENPRLKEPLILHGIFSGMPATINKRNPEFFQEYIFMRQLIQEEKPVEMYKDLLPTNYKKVISAYEYKRDRIANDNDTKLLMRNRIRQIQIQKNITNYRIYTDLGLNPGNVNCFLKNGVVDKLALETVRKIWVYVREK